MAFSATAAAVLASIAMATTALATDFGSAVQLRRAPSGVPMSVSDIATNGEDIAVTWTDTIEPGTLDQYSFMRWSTNGGESFAPKVALNAGAGAVSARVAICGGYAWAITSVQTGPETFGIALDSQQLAGPAHRLGLFDANFSTTTAESLDTGFACAGERRLVAVWSDPRTDPARLMVGIRPLWPCAQDPGPSCDAGPSYTYDLGPKRHGETPFVAATADTIYVAWTKDNGQLRFKRFSLAGDGTVDPHATVTLIDSTAVSNPNLAAFGKRVVLAYDDSGHVRVRVSTNRGVSFGSEIILDPEPEDIDEMATMSVDVRGSRILVETVAGDCVRCYGIDFALGYLSTDGGATWTWTSSPPTGVQLGAFFRAGRVVRIGEAWDQSQTAVDRKRLFFHVGDF